MSPNFTVKEEDELEGLLLAFSPKFRAILQAARSEIKQTGGIPHDEFWQQVDAEYPDTPSHKPVTAPQANGKMPRKRTTRKKRVDLI